MKKTFEQSYKDYLIFYKRNLKRKSILFKPYIFLIAILLAVLLTVLNKNDVIVINSNDLSHTPWGVIINFIGKLGGIIIIIYIVRHVYLGRIQKTLRQNPYLIGPQEIELKDNKLIWKTPTTKTEYLREAFISFEITAEYFYLYKGNYSALIIPKSSNSFDDHLDKWLSKSDSFLNKES